MSWIGLGFKTVESTQRSQCARPALPVIDVPVPDKVTLP
jgi:hypothetical protein